MAQHLYKGGFTVNYLQGLLNPRKVVSEGLSTTLTDLTPGLSIALLCQWRGVTHKQLVPHITETLANLPLPSTEPGMTMSLETFENRLETLL